MWHNEVRSATLFGNMPQMGVKSQAQKLFQTMIICGLENHLNLQKQPEILAEALRVITLFKIHVPTNVPWRKVIPVTRSETL